MAQTETDKPEELDDEFTEFVAGGMAFAELADREPDHAEVTKIPAIHKFENVTLKRGIID